MPIPTVKSISRTKVGNHAGVDRAVVIINFDVPVQAFSVNVIGTSYDSGTIADKGSKYISDLKLKKVSDVKLQTVRTQRLIEGDISAEIDFTELYQEGSNRINIYGKDLSGTWTPYNS